MNILASDKTFIKVLKKSLDTRGIGKVRFYPGTPVQEIILRINAQVYQSSFVYRNAQWYLGKSPSCYKPILANPPQTPLIIQSIEEERTVRKAVMNEIWTGTYYKNHSDNLKMSLASSSRMYDCSSFRPRVEVRYH
jgi:hypothetical protein